MFLILSIVHPKALTVVLYKLHRLARLSVSSSLYSQLSVYSTLMADSILLFYMSDEVSDRSVRVHIHRQQAAELHTIVE